MNRSATPVFAFKLLNQGVSSNRLFEKAASLSYFSLIAFIPLLAAFVSVYVVFFPNYLDQLHLIFKEFLPYQNDQLLLYVQEFVEQARALGGIALIIFFIIAMRVFMIIETNINQVWGVERYRNLGSRISSFTLLLFWGPMLMGLLGSLFFLMQRQHALPALIVYVTPKAITLLTFTMLFWTVPYTKVKISSALLGGVTTTILLTIGKWGFIAYLRGMKGFSSILGSLGLLLLFFIGINLLWFFVLLGTLVAYTHQNFNALKREWVEREMPSRHHQVYWALALITQVARRFLHQESPATVPQLSQDLEVPLSNLQKVVGELVRTNLLLEAGKEGQLLLTRSPDQITVGEIFHNLNAAALEVPSPFDNDINGSLTRYIDRFKEMLQEDIWKTPISAIVESTGSKEEEEDGKDRTDV